MHEKVKTKYKTKLLSFSVKSSRLTPASADAGCRISCLSDAREVRRAPRASRRTACSRTNERHERRRRVLSVAVPVPRSLVRRSRPRAHCGTDWCVWPRFVLTIRRGWICECSDYSAEQGPINLGPRIRKSRGVDPGGWVCWPPENMQEGSENVFIS